MCLIIFIQFLKTLSQVGLKSCQDMIECTDRIWEAGQDQQANVAPNQYPFSLKSLQSESNINAIKNAFWNDNLALGKTVITSSVKSNDLDTYDPFFIVDGKTDTFWESTLSNDEIEWIVLDLGEPYSLQSISISWHYRPSKYSIQLSNNSLAWNETDVVIASSIELPVTDAESIIKTTDISTTVGQYQFIRVYITERINPTSSRGYAISDVSVSTSSLATSKW